MLLAHGRSLDVVSQAELLEAPVGAAPDYETTCAASAIAEVARVCSFEDAEDPFTFAITQRRSRLSAVGSTRHIWTCSWRPLSLNFCRTWAIDPIFRPACCAETPCCRTFRPRRAGSCAVRARRAFRVPSWFRPVSRVAARLMSMTFDALMVERIDPHTAAFLLGLSHVWAATHTDQRLRAMEFMLGR